MNTLYATPALAQTTPISRGDQAMLRKLALIVFSLLVLAAIVLIRNDSAQFGTLFAPAHEDQTLGEAQRTSIRIGDTVAATADGVKLMLGDKLLAVLTKGSRMLVTTVESGWIGGRIMVSGKPLSGWIRKTDLVRATEAIVARKQPDHPEKSSDSVTKTTPAKPSSSPKKVSAKLAEILAERKALQAKNAATRAPGKKIQQPQTGIAEVKVPTPPKSKKQSAGQHRIETTPPLSAPKLSDTPAKPKLKPAAVAAVAAVPTETKPSKMPVKPNDQKPKATSPSPEKPGTSELAAKLAGVTKPVFEIEPPKATVKPDGQKPMQKVSTPPESTAAKPADQGAKVAKRPTENKQPAATVKPDVQKPKITSSPSPKVIPSRVVAKPDQTPKQPSSKKAAVVPSKTPVAKPEPKITSKPAQKPAPSTPPQKLADKPMVKPSVKPSVSAKKSPAAPYDVQVLAIRSSYDLANLASEKSIGLLILGGRSISNNSLRRLQGMTIGALSIDLPTDITGTALRHLAQIKGLKSLRLWLPQINDKSLKHVGELRSLEKLDLEGAGLQGAGLQYLKNLPKLRVLALGPGIRDESLQYLGACTQLRQLDLRACSRLTPACLDQLGKLKQLESLFVPSQFGSQGRRVLRRSLPDCEIRS